MHLYDIKLFISAIAGWYLLQRALAWIKVICLTVTCQYFLWYYCVSPTRPTVGDAGPCYTNHLCEQFLWTESINQGTQRLCLDRLTTETNLPTDNWWTCRSATASVCTVWVSRKQFCRSKTVFLKLYFVRYLFFRIYCSLKLVSRSRTTLLISTGNFVLQRSCL